MNMKRILALGTASLMMLLTLASCGAAPAAGTSTSTATPEGEAPVGLTMNPAGYATSAEKLDFNILMGFAFPSGVVLWDSPNDIPFYKDYIEKTNMEMSWETVARADFKQKMNIMIAGDDLPDAFMKTSGVTDAELIQHGSSGSIINIEPYLEKWAPDLNKYLEDNNLKDSMRLGSGIWGLPYLYDSDGITIGKIFFHEDWLQRVDMPMPTSIDEITQTLRAFKAVAAADEFPLGIHDMDQAVSMFGSAYGLFNRGTSNRWIDADPADATGKTLRFWRGDEAIKDVLKLMKQYYAEGLLPTNFFNTTDNTTLMNNATMVGKAGAHALWATVAGPEAIDKYIPMETAPMGPDGKTMWNVVSGKIGSRAAMLITKDCENPEALIAWANYFYTKEGSLNYFLGKEGESYTVDADGQTVLTDAITKDPAGLSQAQAQYKHSLAGGGGNPGLATDNTFKGGETYWTSLQGSKNFKPFIPTTIWERLPLDEALASRVSGPAADMDAVIKEYEAKFVTGVLDIDADWDEYQKKLDQAGRETYVDVYTQALAKLA